MLIVMTDIIFVMVCFSSEMLWLNFEKAIRLSPQFLYVSCIYLVELMSLKVLVILYLFVLDSNVAVFAQLC